MEQKSFRILKPGREKLLKKIYEVFELNSFRKYFALNTSIKWGENENS